MMMLVSEIILTQVPVVARSRA